MAGPLTGLKIVEMVGIGPAPFCAMMFADMGAEVIRIDRLGAADAASLSGKREPRFDVLARGRRSLALDLKNPKAVETVLTLDRERRRANRRLSPRASWNGSVLVRRSASTATRGWSMAA